MLTYRATEKDCQNGEGEEEECIVCFETFQPGELLTRLECLCKFHQTCLQGWWDAKARNGVGAGGDVGAGGVEAGVCPVHYLGV